MTYVMKVLVPDDMIYNVSRLSSKLVQTLADKTEHSSGLCEHYSRYKVNKNYHFTDEYKADMFYHILKQIIMYQRYEKGAEIWGYYLFHGGSYRQDYNRSKQQQAEVIINCDPGEQEYKNMITELYLTPESEPESIFDSVGILGPKYSYNFILDQDRIQWCLGWNNADMKDFKILGCYELVNKCDDFIKQVPEILFNCDLLYRMQNSVQYLEKLDKIMPGFSEYLQQKKTNSGVSYPYNKLPGTKEWQTKFGEWYAECSDSCLKQGNCSYCYWLDRNTKIEGEVCRRFCRMIQKDGFNAENNAFKDYKKIVSRSNRIEMYRQKHQIKR